MCRDRVKSRRQREAKKLEGGWGQGPLLSKLEKQQQASRGMGRTWHCVLLTQERAAETAGTGAGARAEERSGVQGGRQMLALLISLDRFPALREPADETAAARRCDGQ